MHEACKAIFEKISAYLDGDLDEQTCLEIHKHLEVCPECSDRFESLKKTVEVCKSLPKERVSKEIHERLRATLKAALDQGPG